MEAGDQSSDDEVFMGEITEKEKQHPQFMSRRRTTLYFPGISRPDSTVTVFHELTDDGTLIFSCEDDDRMHTDMVSEASADAKPENSIATYAQAHRVSLRADCTRTASSWSKAEAQGGLGCTFLANDSDYCSVSDGSLESSLDSFSAVACSVAVEDVPHLTANKEASAVTAEDRKRKRSQVVSPKVRTVQLQSPHLLVCPRAHFPDPAVSSPVVKRHIACKRVSAHGESKTTPSSTTTSPTPSPNVLLQSSESAFSRLQLKSPKREAKCVADLDEKSPPLVIKDFPPSKNTLAKFGPGTPDAQQLLPPMKRKISKRSPPEELRVRSGSYIEQELSPISVSGTQKRSKNCVSDSPSGLDLENKLEETCMLSGGDVTCDRSETTSEGYSEKALVCSASVSAEGDAQSVKYPSVFVPETPDTRSGIKHPVKTHVRFGRVLSPDLHGDYEIIPSSQVSEKTMASPEKQSSAQAAPLSPLSIFHFKSCRNLSSKNIPAFNKQPALADLFSSPAAFEKLTSQSQLSEGEVSYTPVHSPVPASRVSVKFRSSTCSTSLQPIEEDGAEVKELEDITEDCCVFPDCSVSRLRNERKDSVPVEQSGTLALKGGATSTSGEATLGNGGENKENETVVFSSDSEQVQQLDNDRLSDHGLVALAQASSGSRKHEWGTSGVGDVSGAGDERNDVQSPRPGYRGMTFAHLKEYLQNGRRSPFDESVQHRGAKRGTSPSASYFRSNTSDGELEEESREAMTRINTLINGEIRHELLDPASSPALLMDFPVFVRPAPKEATRVSWSESVVLEESSVTQQQPLFAATPRSILQRRSADDEFPFSKDPPSPIVLTRRRQPRFPRLFSS